MAINFTPAQLDRLPMLAEGGEAKIFEYKAGTLIKKFKPHIDIRRKEVKVQKFATAKLPKDVVGPKELVTEDGKFVGYAMNSVKNAEDLHQLTRSKYLKIAGLSNKDILEMLIQAGKTLSNLHKNGVIIGDISDYNILMKAKEVFFIDVDSWGVTGLFSPDAYTELFTDPECYNNTGNPESGIKKQTIESDLFSFAVLCFNMLTRIHPFNGTYEKDMDMSTTKRMKKKISVLGNHSIIIPKLIPSWKWMSPELEKVFLEIFEKDKRVDIVKMLEDQAQNTKFCKIHNVYYYSKYSECPICSKKAKIIPTPAVIKVDTKDGPKIIIVFETTDIKVLLSKDHYLNSQNEVIHIQSKRKVKLKRGKQVEFSEDGKLVLYIDQESIEIWDENNKTQATIERMFKTPYHVEGNNLYYIDKSGNFIKLKMNTKGNIPQIICQVNSPLFAVGANGETFAGSFYPKKAIIRANNYNFELLYNGKIKEYAIKYDPKTKKWIFIYLLPNGKHRTIIFGDKKYEYDDTIIRYNVSPLSGICFYNDTIYIPGDGKIVGINYHKNLAKEFNCDIVAEDSKLEFDGKRFTIINDDKIYHFGN